MPVYQLEDKIPQIHETAWIAPGVQVVGQARLEAYASIWFGAVVRADNDWVHIGENSNIQDGCIIHNDPGMPVKIGANVTVGHQAMLHSCEVGDGSLVGMQAILLSGCRIGKNSLVGAGSLVTEGKAFPDGVLILGRPARVARQLTQEEIERIQQSALGYKEKAQIYKGELKALKDTHV